MTVIYSPRTGGSQPIIVSRPEERVDPEALGDQLAELARRRRITRRDEQLLEHLLATGVLSLAQIRRLLWAEAREKTAADRLSKLWQWRLVRRARSPWSRYGGLGLTAGPVFGLGVGGWWWLVEPEPEEYAYRLIEARWVWRQLLAAEVYTRLAAGGAGLGWQPDWRGTPAAFEAARPSAVVTVRTEAGQAATLALELAVTERVELEAKVRAYDAARERGQAVTVMLILARAAQVAQAAALIRQQRRQGVPYLLGSWDQLLGAAAWLSPPLWLAVGWQTASRRVGLLEGLNG